MSKNGFFRRRLQWFASFSLLAALSFAAQAAPVQLQAYGNPVTFTPMDQSELSDSKDGWSAPSGVLNEQRLYLDNNLVMIRFSKQYLTTTGGAYIKTLGVVEKAESMEVHVEMVSTQFCKRVNKQVKFARMGLSFHNHARKPEKVVIHSHYACQQ